MAESIQRIEMIYGKIPNIFSIGNGAKIVYEHLVSKKSKNQEKNGDIDCMILIDRKVDLITPLCT